MDQKKAETRRKAETDGLEGRGGEVGEGGRGGRERAWRKEWREGKRG